MSSAEDADDERESAAPTPITPWIDPKSLQFTVFVVLPNEEVCTMRDIPSGTTVFDLKGKLEIIAGIPSHIYTLVYTDGEEIVDDQKLMVQENILDGYLIKMHLIDSWESLYTGVTRNNIEHVYHSGGVHLKGNISISSDESERYNSVIRERGFVALYMASFCGHQRMVSMLLSVGANVNGKTQFGRTALHAAVSKDHLSVLVQLLDFGASIRTTDYFGLTPLELSRELTSSLCTKKLRLMQLNLRGNVDQRPPVMSSANRSSNKSLRNGPSTSEPRLLSRAQAETPREDKERSGVPRTVSNISQYSEISAFSNKSQDLQVHKSRKHVISSAPDGRQTNHKLIFRKYSPSPTLTKSGTANVLQRKRAVRWRDVPKENMYWQVIELPNKEDHSIEKAVSVKPVAIIQQKKILKFANGMRVCPSPEPCPAAPSASPTHESAGKEQELHKLDPKVVRFTKAKMRYFRKLTRELDTTRQMRRRIKMVADHEKTTASKEVSEAFREWLEKKTREDEQSDEDVESVVSVHDSEDSDKETYDEFNKRIRKRNRLERRSITPGNRPISDIIRVGSTKAGDSANPSPYLNVSAHSDWKKLRTAAVRKTSIRRGKSVNDFMVEKSRLEIKRQKLLMNAITYEEWMDHVEDRKFLIKQILKADYEEMKRLEEERFKDRLDRHSFEKWKDKLQQREVEERKRKEIQRKYDAECALDKLRAGRSTHAVTFNTWLSKKRDTNQKHSSNAKSSVNRQGLDDVETESAYEQWIHKKHRNEPKLIGSQVKKERELLGAMRQLRTESVA